MRGFEVGATEPGEDEYEYEYEQWFAAFPFKGYPALLDAFSDGLRTGEAARASAVDLADTVFDAEGSRR